MSNIIQFPKIHKELICRRQESIPAPAATVASPSPVKRKRFLSGVFGAIWLFTVLLSPLLEWVLKYDVVFQFIRMLYYWNKPSMHAGWTFLLHFGVLSVLFFYVMYGKPKDFDLSPTVSAAKKSGPGSVPTTQKKK